MPETARGSRFDPSKCVAASGEAQCISASCRKIMEILIMQSPLMKALQSPLTISRLKSQDDLNCKAQYSSFFFRTSALLHFQAPYPYLRFGGGFLPGCDVSALSLSRALPWRRPPCVACTSAPDGPLGKPMPPCWGSATGLSKITRRARAHMGDGAHEVRTEWSSVSMKGISFNPNRSGHAHLFGTHVGKRVI